MNPKAKLGARKPSARSRGTTTPEAHEVVDQHAENARVLRDLIARVQSSADYDRELNIAICQALSLPAQAEVTSNIGDAGLLYAFTLLPHWWVKGLGEKRTAIVCRGDRHMPLSPPRWFCCLQHERGGRLARGTAQTMPRAMVAAVLQVCLDRLTGVYGAPEDGEDGED